MEGSQVEGAARFTVPGNAGREELRKQRQLRHLINPGPDNLDLMPVRVMPVASRLSDMRTVIPVSSGEDGRTFETG